MSRSRSWCLTVNNWTVDQLAALKGLTGVTYGVMGREVGESGTPHLQGYLRLTNATTMRGVSMGGSFPRWLCSSSEEDASCGSKRGQPARGSWNSAAKPDVLHKRCAQDYYNKAVNDRWDM